MLTDKHLREARAIAGEATTHMRRGLAVPLGLTLLCLGFVAACYAVGWSIDAALLGSRTKPPGDFLDRFAMGAVVVIFGVLVWELFARLLRRRNIEQPRYQQDQQENT